MNGAIESETDNRVQEPPPHGSGAATAIACGWDKQRAADLLGKGYWFGDQSLEFQQRLLAASDIRTVGMGVIGRWGTAFPGLSGSV